MTRVTKGRVVYAEHRTQFVFLDGCGCPLGLVEGSYAKTEDGAWNCFADTREDERALRRRGVSVVHVPHEQYVAEYYERMKAICPHGGTP